MTETATLTAGQKAAITRRANIAALADGSEKYPLNGPDGRHFTKGASCITCLASPEQFPANQLPGNHPDYPQCAECLAFEYRRIARIASGETGF